MTADEMRGWFGVLQTGYVEDYFTDAEIDEFLFDAIWDYINEFIGDGDTPPTLERNRGATNAIGTLIETSTAVNIPSTGLLTDVLINAAVSSTSIIQPISIALATGEPVHFVRHNDVAVFEQNTYKKGSSLVPNYTIVSSGNDVGQNSYQFYPKEAYTGILVTAIVQPDAITDLPVYKHHEQVAKAMTKAGFTLSSKPMIALGKSEGKAPQDAWGERTWGAK